MPDARRLIYWDTPVWLSYIQGILSRLPILDALLADSASNAGSIRIVASVLSQVEVAFLEQERSARVLDPDVEANIDRLWADRHAVQLVEYHEAIGREARSLIRMAMTKGWSLKPMDAIHLGTAKWSRVSEFQTYDNKLLKYSNDVGFPIVEPHAEQGRFDI